MALRRLAAALAVGALVACEPSVPQSPSPGTVDYLVFDPASSQIPQPNDLALQPTTLAGQQGAQRELLEGFAAQGGFPNDQEVPITIDVQRFAFGDGAASGSAPEETSLDPASVRVNAPGGSVLVLERPIPAAGQPAANPTPTDPATLEVALVPGLTPDRKTLTIRRKADPAANPPGSRRWKPGTQYIVLVRGGENGVKLAGGRPVTAFATTYLITRGVNLAQSENQYLLPGAGRPGRAQTGAQLEQLRQSYLPVFGAAEAVWGAGATQQIASVQTFRIAPVANAAAPRVVTDASAGVVPLPSDLLLDPANGGKTIVNNPAFGGLAAGIATLDGFSTTAMILSQTSSPVVAATVNKDTVFLYDLSNPAAPVRVRELREAAAGVTPGFVAEPFQITQKPTGATTTVPCTATDPTTGCFSTAIGLQPAVPVPLPTGQVSLPPLKEGTEYAVLITDGVAGPPPGGTGSPVPLQRSTLSRILLFENPVADADGKSLLGGQADATAAGLERMRQGVAAAARALQAERSIAKERIALGYTFRTQTITGVATRLAAAPYANQAAFVPAASTSLAGAPGVPALSAASAVLLATIPTLNPISVATGALEPDNTKWTPAALSAIVVAPQPAAVTASCPAPNGALKCAPLVVFQHGLGQDKTNVFGIANTLAAAGFVVAAIDAPLHGNRGLCTADAECTCTELGAAATCTATCGLFPAGAQGDATRTGVCTAGSVARGVASGASSVSGRFFVSANFFRTRDALRQSVLDTSALVLALAPLSASANPVATALGGAGVAVDSTKVYWVGQSLGGILGTLNLAANPRFSRGVLNVPGATLTDIFTQSASFAPATNALLASLTPPITPGTPEFLRFVQVAKLVLDAGEPLNYAPHVTANPLPNPLANPAAAQTPKRVFGQYAVCDQTIPNPFNLLLFDNMGLTPGGQNPRTAYTVAGAAGAPACAGGTNPHGFLLSPVADPAATAAGQTDAAAFLSTLAIPPATRP